MFRIARRVPWCALAGVALTAPALADFAGQPILGTLSAGDLVSGTTLGKADDNDGFDSGIHIFNIWDGGDDVWKINWLGGSMAVTLDSLGGSDNDLFIYRPSDLNSSSNYSIVGSHDVVSIPNAAAGVYYVNVDSTFFSEGRYELSVAQVPAPATGALLGVGVLCMTRRRR